MKVAIGFRTAYVVGKHKGPSCFGVADYLDRTKFFRLRLKTKH